MVVQSNPVSFFPHGGHPILSLFLPIQHRGGACEGRRRTTRSRRRRRTGGLQATPDTSISRSDQWCGRRSNTGFQRRRRTGGLQATLDASRRRVGATALNQKGNTLMLTEVRYCTHSENTKKQHWTSASVAETEYRVRSKLRRAIMCRCRSNLTLWSSSVNYLLRLPPGRLSLTLSRTSRPLHKLKETKVVSLIQHKLKETKLLTCRASMMLSILFHSFCYPQSVILLLQ